MNIYWYELIHRPISNNTQPKGFIEIEHDHINRNGFNFGKVGYAAPLIKEQLISFDMEPVNKEGLHELESISQDKLNMNRIKITVELLHYLIDNDIVKTIKENNWTYINLSEVKATAEERKSELRIIYRQIKKGSTQ